MSAALSCAATGISVWVGEGILFGELAAGEDTHPTHGKEVRPLREELQA
jgi:hypothetical protein